MNGINGNEPNHAAGVRYPRDFFVETKQTPAGVQVVAHGMRVAIAGMTKKDIVVTVANRQIKVKIAGFAKADTPETVRNHPSFGYCPCASSVPSQEDVVSVTASDVLDLDRVSVKVENGLLTLTVPVKESAFARVIDVK